MKFIQTKYGRTVQLDMSEKICICCKKTENDDRWYYYDHPAQKGLYCRYCAINANVIIDKKRRYQFWLVDKFQQEIDTSNLNMDN